MPEKVKLVSYLCYGAAASAVLTILLLVVWNSQIISNIESEFDGFVVGMPSAWDIGFNAWIYLILGLSAAAIGFIMTKPKIKIPKFNQYSIGFFGVLGLWSLVNIFTSASSPDMGSAEANDLVPGWFLFMGPVLFIVTTALVAYGMFIIFKNEDVKNWLDNHGGQASPSQLSAGAVPPPGGQQQPGGYPPQGGQPGQQPGFPPGQQPPYSR